MCARLPLFPSVQQYIESTVEPHTSLGESYKRALPVEVQSDDSEKNSDNSLTKKRSHKKHKDSSKRRRHYSSKRDRKSKLEDGESVLFLPNGSFVVTTSLETSEDWKIDKSGDEDIFQFGAAYRLDIPSYDIFVSKNGGSQQVSSDAILRLTDKRRGVATPSSQKPTTRDKYSSNFLSRYFAPKAHDPFSSSSIVSEEVPLYRPRILHLSRDGSAKRARASTVGSSFVPFPPPLVRLGLAQSAVSAAVVQSQAVADSGEEGGDCFATDKEVFLPPFLPSSVLIIVLAITFLSSLFIN
jgi:hypothetical protein